MITCGVDVGSLTAKAVVYDAAAARVVGQALTTGSGEAETVGRKVLGQALEQACLTETDVAACVGTGYGRVSLSFVTRKVTEITCHGRGIYHLWPQTRTVIDVGGQDSKVIRLDDGGRVLDFEMNDRCAAGTGRFLEVMAAALGCDLPGLIMLAQQSEHPATVSSTCTVFAESEVVGLLAHGTAPADVAAGLCTAVAQRIAGLVWRLGLETPAAFTGGVALNQPVLEALSRALDTPLLRPAEPQMTGALGAALLAVEEVLAPCI